MIWIRFWIPTTGTGSSMRHTTVCYWQQLVVAVVAAVVAVAFALVNYLQ